VIVTDSTPDKLKQSQLAMPEFSYHTPAVAFNDRFNVHAPANVHETNFIPIISISLNPDVIFQTIMNVKKIEDGIIKK